VVAANAVFTSGNSPVFFILVFPVTCGICVPPALPGYTCSPGLLSLAAGVVLELEVLPVVLPVVLEPLVLPVVLPVVSVVIPSPCKNC
jgi:hypothetical protein